jgi:outer membrane receptor protein involved in Fe transport
MRSTLRQRLMASTLLLGAATIATPAWAQPSDDDTQENAASSSPDPTGSADGRANEADPITVTGSRIQRRDLTSTSPLAVVQDEEFKLSGTINVEQVLNTLPQVIPGTTAFSNNPGGGVATLNLRGLGSTRTLVLVNGRRYMFFDVTQRVDLNTIPSFLIDSVDVVTGGASAVYGSDALAGVVNFRLQNDLEGLIAGGQYSITEEGDGARYNAYMAVGASTADGRGRVTAFGEYFNRRAVLQGDRAFSRFATGQPSGVDVCVNPATVNPSTNVGTVVGTINQTTGTCATGVPGFGAAGSSTIPGGRVTIPATATVGPDPDGNGPLTAPTQTRGVGAFATGSGGLFTTPGSPARAFVGATDAFNFAPENFLQVPQERWLLGGYGEYEVTSGVTAYTEVTFANNRVINALAATPVTGTFNINVAQACTFVSAADCAAFQQIDANETAINAQRAANGLGTLFTGANAPANAAGTISASVNRRVSETGSRITEDERNAFRALAGVRGSITDSLSYDAYYFFSRTRNANIQQGNISRSAFQAGLNGAGTPINIFGLGALTADQVSAITITAQNQDISNLQVAQASINGVLGNFGLGADDIGFAVGTEFRSMSSRFIPDTALSSGDVIGFNAGDPTEGGYNVKEVFGELRVPLIADRPGFHRLELTGAVRYSDYSLEAVGGVWSYAGGVEFAPIRDVTFRAQYQRAVRAPNVGELFGGQSNGFPVASDPCAQASAATNATIRQLCIQTGVPASLVGSSTVQQNSQIEATFGGNPNLQEETADTYTAGVIIRPSFIPRLNIAIDGYDITIDDSISTLGGGLANTLELCFNTIQDINSQFCQAIVGARDPETGQIGGDFLPQILNANIGRLATRGIDLQVDYSLPLSFSMLGRGEGSRLNFFFLGTYVDEYDITPVADLPDEINECAGRFGALACGDPIPRYKWSSRLSFIDGPMTLSGRWRHIGAVRDDDDDTFYTVERIGAVDYFDLSFAYDVSDGLRLSLGVNNLLDRKPPFVGTNQEQANTYPGTYDVLGRDFFVSAALRF